MAVNICVIESLSATTLVDVEKELLDVTAYLSQQRRMGVRLNRKADTVEEILKAFEEFAVWGERFPSEDWVVLWVSLHGMPPGSPNLVGTSAGSAAYSSEKRDEELQWFEALLPLGRKWHPKTIVLLDVCWGSSPTFSRSATGATKPLYVFGPVREAARLELNAAASLIFGTLGKLGELSMGASRGIVDQLNATFPSDVVTRTEFYRMWWWDKDGVHRHPSPH